MVRGGRSIALLFGLILVGSAGPVVGQEPDDGAEPSAEPEAPSGGSPVPEASFAVELSPDPDATSGVEPSPTSSPLPELAPNLSRLKMPDVPLFAGPASLRVSGGRGEYRWPDVRFGAQQARVKVALRPRKLSCAAHVRLVEDDGPVFDEWFSVDGGVKEIREVVVESDYGAGRLKVDSDCKQWGLRFDPLPDPELPLNLEQTFYTVRGDSIDELVRQTAHIEGKWAAYTEWHTRWSYQTEQAEDGASCDLVSGETALEVTLTSPRWKRPKDADPAVAAEWQRFREALRVHELGHVTIALQGADAIDDRLDTGLTAPTCDEAREAADKRATRVFDRYSSQSRRYDRDTDHGLTQGTGLK